MLQQYCIKRFAVEMNVDKWHILQMRCSSTDSYEFQNEVVFHM